MVELQSSQLNNAPIGIFDSGYGGLTVVREICKRLPQENIVFVGDSARCPYGPRDLDEVDSFVQQICTWLTGRKVKMIVIACNTATAAGLTHAQQTFDVPVIGVVEPGARAAVQTTKNRNVGVIATKGTIDSGVYTRAIHNLDAGINVYSAATPRFVEIAEMGVQLVKGPIEDYSSSLSEIYVCPEFEEIAREYLNPLEQSGIDTLVLGCTHYPLLKALLGSVIGQDVTFVSSAEETARDVEETLARQGAFAQPNSVAHREFFTTGADVEEFKRFGERVLAFNMDEVSRVDLNGF